MNKIKKFGLIFKNNIGLVSKVSEHIYTNNGNILQSSMIKVGNHFAFDIEATIPEGKHNLFDNFIINNQCKIKFKEDNKYLSKIKLYCSDNSGIIHSACKSMEDLNCDIIKLETNVEHAPFSSISLFSMEMTFFIDKRYSKEDIEKSLIEVKDKYNCEFEILSKEINIPTIDNYVTK